MIQPNHDYNLISPHFEKLKPPSPQTADEKKENNKKQSKYIKENQEM